MEERLCEAAKKVLPSGRDYIFAVKPCADPRFGDYQTSAVMGLAKELRTNPRQLAVDIVSRLDVSQWCERVEVAGGGFINFRLKPAAMAEVLKEAAQGKHLFFNKTDKPRTIVVDFSSPNVAKPMHVGHIRSTILGDCLARTFRLLGHRVITDNHLGDWGTQFGKLILGWKKFLDREALEKAPIAEMERLYKLVNEKCESDNKMIEEARRELVLLQQGDRENLEIWQKMIELSRKEFDAIYARLNVKFDYTLGESFYNPRLNSVVNELIQKGIARESEGAIVVFFDDDPYLKDKPAIIKKSDGGFNYATTDLATLAYRVETWNPDEIIYVTDGRQQLHFQQIFATFRKWHPELNDRLKLVHVWFGSILGEDGKPFKTRSGETVKLADLLDEAEERAYRVVSEKNPQLSEEARRNIARVVGIGAVKYADLLPNRQMDYVFSWDKMLALNGNTAPYLQYAYARIRSIFRKGGIDDAGREEQMEYSLSGMELSAAEEIALVRHLLNFGLSLEAVGGEYRPNLMCNYLYELAGLFARFYETCPVLKAEEPQRSTRLAICDLTAKVLKQGLDILGIDTLEQM
ncbi:MAG: arginine--tRNA ligase [Verrucomicrobiia bacterium]